MLQAAMSGMEVPIGATVKCMLKPFTAAKSADAVAGDDGPVMRFPIKRKAVAGSGYDEGLQPPEGWIDDFVGADTTSFDPVVIGEMLHEAKLPAPVPGRKHRLSKAEIWTILALNPGQFELPTSDYLDDLTDIFSPSYIEERKRQTEAYAEVCKNIFEESEAFRQRVIKSVRENGYFEVDDQFLINREKANQRALEDSGEIDFGGLIFAPDEEEEPYVLDKDDAAVLDLLSEDE